MLSHSTRMRPLRRPRPHPLACHCRSHGTRLSRRPPSAPYFAVSPRPCLSIALAPTTLQSPICPHRHLCLPFGGAAWRVVTGLQARRHPAHANHALLPNHSPHGGPDALRMLSHSTRMRPLRTPPFALFTCHRTVPLRRSPPLQKVSGRLHCSRRTAKERGPGGEARTPHTSEPFQRNFVDCQGVRRMELRSNSEATGLPVDGQASRPRHALSVFLARPRPPPHSSY